MMRGNLLYFAGFSCDSTLRKETFNSGIKPYGNIGEKTCHQESLQWLLNCSRTDMSVSGRLLVDCSKCAYWSSLANTSLVHMSFTLSLMVLTVESSLAGYVEIPCRLS